MELDKSRIEADFRALIGPLCDAVGPAGFEDEVSDFLRKELSDCNVELSDDVMGNLIAYKKGNKKGSILVSAHMDEIGLIVRHIDSKGFLWVETLGGIAPQQFFGKHVIIKTETGHVDGIVQSLHPGRPDRCTEMPKSAQEFYIEVGAESRDEVYEMGIEEGNSVSICYPVIFLGKHRVGAKALDDRALVFILLEVLKLLKDDADVPDIYGLFSTQEEVGARGAIAAATRLKPDVALALDMSLAVDIPGVSESRYINELGRGTSIKVMDKLSAGVGGILANRDLVRELKTIAKAHDIPYQIEAYAAGATDASFMQTLNGGIKSGGIQIPMRYVHSYEVCDIRDVVDSVELLYWYIKEAQI